MIVLAVALLIGIVWYLAGRTSRSAAGQGSAAVAANASAAPTMTGVLANSTGPSRSTVPSPSPSPSAPPSPSPAVGGSAGASVSPTATDVPGSITDSAGAAADPAAGADAAPATDAAPASPPQTAPAAPAPPPPSYDADGRLLCVDTSVALTAKVPAEVRSGSTVIVGMTITNSGTEACRRDVSGTLQVFTVFGADGTRLWSTADCFPGEGTEVRDLTPGQSVEYTVKWSGTTSAPGCAGDRTPLPPGSYTLIAQLGALSSPPAAFTVG